MRLYLEDNLDGVQSYAVDERVHHIGRVARRARVETEEARVVSQGLGGTNGTREANVRVLVVLVDEREHEVVDVVEGTLSHIVQDRVGSELALALLGPEPLLVQLRQLCLALIELDLRSRDTEERGCASW